MFESSVYISQLSQCNNPEELLSRVNSIVNSFSSNEFILSNIRDYSYDKDLAMEELGLESEEVEQLFNDYISQILKACDTFLILIHSLKKMFHDDTYEELRDLAHKNLGVARNLRVKNAQKFLYNIMTLENLDVVKENVEALILSSILLNSRKSFLALQLLKEKI